MPPTTEQTDSPQQCGRSRAPAEGLYVVGIGASSGALGALRTLFSRVPESPGVAFVVVVHLSPEHESHLVELLQPYTQMKVQQVRSTVALEPNNVYVIPPNANLSAIDTHLRLSELEERRVERAPIDHFFRTLATTHDGASIGVVLTGAGSDGALGLREIKEHGGLTVAQDPGEAEYDSMPRNAIATGTVDAVLPVHDIADEILAFCATQPRVPTPDANDNIGEQDHALFELILGELRRRTGEEFAVYKRSTVLRRIRRRMQLRHVETLADYLEVMRRRPDEAKALFDELVLSVTEFFRESEVFATLEHSVLPSLFERGDERVRVWSIGCSTGEEAYSLAMLMLEQAKDRESRPQLQVFASELSDELLQRARDGVYPAEVAANVSPERLERFFVRELGHYRIRPEVRDIVVFAAHNVFRDPPFARLDMIVCRNLLRELQPEVRRGVLSVFHYALEPHGVLVVGPGDHVDVPHLFMHEGDGRVLRRTTGPRQPLTLPPSVRPFARESRLPDWRVAESFEHPHDVRALHRQVLERHAPPSVLIDESNDVIHYSSRASAYLRIPGGELTHDVTRLVRQPLRSQLDEAIRTVRQQQEPWASKPLAVKTEAGLRRIVLRVEPTAANTPGVLLVVFDEIKDAEVPDVPVDGGASDAIARLQKELGETHRRLRTLVGTHAVAPPEPAAAVEASRQELAVILEELESSREELQAVNEELVTLDEENRYRLDELAQLSADLQHLLESTGVATVFLDRELKIVRFTPQAAEMFNIRRTDVGRPLSDLRHELHYVDLVSDAGRVLEDVVPVDREIASLDGRWFLTKVLPYRTQAQRVDGVVFTLVDVTERKRAEERLREADRRKDEFLAMLAHELRNPLAPISAGVEVLKRAGNDPRVVAQVSATMARQTRQLVRLVDDLLEVSRVTGGRLRLRLTAVNLADVIRDAVAAVRPLLEGAEHDLTIDLPEEPILLAADSARLTQVVANLLHNAARYTPKKGTIAVTLTRAGDEATVSVRDTGVGIPAETLGRVFEMFYQGNDARVTRNAGLGIGLTLAKSLVEMHGGTISVASEGLDCGSEFTIRLPIVSAAGTTAPQQAPVEAVANIGGHRVLIVDDNHDAADTLSMVVRTLGENVVRTAVSGAAALDTAPEFQPDIVLLDLKMPGMDGYEVARRIRATPWGKHVMLVALTGFGQDEHKRRTKAAGFDHHLTKPADRAALEAVLSERRATARSAS